MRICILAGEHDPMKLAKLRHDRCHSTVVQLARALEGTWRPEHLFELRQARALFYFHHDQINECDEQIRAELAKLVNRAGTKGVTGKRRRRGRKHNDVRFDARFPCRIGGLGAVKATAHKLARLVYQMLKYGEEYVQTSMEDYAAKMQENLLRSLKRKALAMGYELAPLQT